MTDNVVSDAELLVDEIGAVASFIRASPDNPYGKMKYRTIVADPPWEYPEGFVHGRAPGWREDPTRADVSKRVTPFQQMSVAAISALPVSDLGERAAALFLWTTNRYLGSAYSVMEAWGFKYRQCLVWDKAGNASPFGGSIAPNQLEFLLVGRRGAHRWQGRWPSNLVSASRTRHSRKPDVFGDLIETVSPGPYLELFARRQRLGWDTWGHEALNHVEMTA